MNSDTWDRLMVVGGSLPASLAALRGREVGESKNRRLQALEGVVFERKAFGRVVDTKRDDP